jgi:chemotaxis protein histidine kinase CheA
MGIGSYETHQYIREIGGSVSVDSEPGRGTAVTVLLPVLDIGQTAVTDLYDSTP